MSPSEVTLFDLPTKKTTPSTCWSPNVWKTRLVLNYKKIPYTTHWIKHDELESTLSAVGIPPNTPKQPGQPGSSPYTCPAIQLADGLTAMDSAVIAPILEERYPTPSLHLENGLHEEASALVGRIAFPLLAILFPRIMRNVILPEIAPYWRAKKEAVIGMTMEEFEEKKGGETAWKAAEPGFVAMSKFLKEKKQDEGPFILGSQVCYGDFVVVALAEAMKRVSSEMYDRAMASCEGYRELHQACGPWIENDL